MTSYDNNPTTTKKPPPSKAEIEANYEQGDRVAPRRLPVVSINGYHVINSPNPIVAGSIWESGGKILVDFSTERGIYLAKDFAKPLPAEELFQIPEDKLKQAAEFSRWQKHSLQEQAQALVNAILLNNNRPTTAPKLVLQILQLNSYTRHCGFPLRIVLYSGIVHSPKATYRFGKW